MIHLIIRLKQIVDNLDDRIVEAECLRICIATKLVGYVHLLSLLELKHKHLFLKFNFSNHSFQIENISQAANTKHELDLCQLRRHLHFLELHLQLDATRPLLVHLQILHNYVIEDIATFCFIKQLIAGKTLVTRPLDTIFFGT